ncbi:13451_t:CDS:1, partial [Dentiscutata erythropus]
QQLVYWQNPIILFVKTIKNLSVVSLLTIDSPKHSSLLALE